MMAFGFYALTPVERLGVALARYTFAGRGSIRPLIEKLFLPARETPRDGVIWGGMAKLRLPPKSSLKYLIADQRYNSPERDYLRTAVRDGDVIADIGANIGFYTLWFGALQVPGTRIVAVEPNPSVYDALVENVRLNGLDNVVTIRAALGAQDGSVSFGIRPDAPSVGSILATDAEQITVPMRSLASILEEQGLARCDVVKIDVEGYEYQALMPYLEAIPQPQWPRLLVIEQNHRSRQWEGDLVDVFLRNGYRVVMKTRGNIVLEKIEQA
ncbi:FkbM family methyltransferase [Hyphomicrobium sp.]|uniref:FkbM family methyltransferase n=1 Tax=Hyphomicrobium sp. TaxID=82 RepID=UPI0025B96EC1|nr:FkbM family methyltransferase [Hyphomicrobium sp.]MCC7252730.1 FkbM family methyltransferase [Hyphomicrobium sp.]